jgi:hypothetical protein
MSIELQHGVVVGALGQLLGVVGRLLELGVQVTHGVFRVLAVKK